MASLALALTLAWQKKNYEQEHFCSLTSTLHKHLGYIIRRAGILTAIKEVHLLLLQANSGKLGSILLLIVHSKCTQTQIYTPWPEKSILISKSYYLSALINNLLDNSVLMSQRMELMKVFHRIYLNTNGLIVLTSFQIAW